MERELEGKTAIITGAGASGPGWGTGKATAVTFARAGAKVVLFDVNASACAATETLIDQEGGEAMCVVGDVSCWADVQQLMKKCIERFGALDVLVNNVGILMGHGLLKESPEQWERTVSVNAKGVFLTSKAAVPHMLARGAGRIINVASVAGIRVSTLPPSYGYSASKAAVLQMTKAMALEFADKGLRCNCIIPGMLDTTNVRTAYANLGQSEKDIESHMRRRDALAPTGRQGSAFEVAYAALFLASDRVNFVNGAEILIDGGAAQGTMR
jgi:NAD(P)-dependent dehydrogenase (short-subunit alcohol dehydrogenase family)